MPRNCYLYEKLLTVTNDLFHIVKDSLLTASKDANHPFRYFTMATTGINNSPRLRTVVLRNVKEDLTLSIYTDRRSKKVTHIKENNNVCLLFFDHAKMLQLKVDGKAHIEESAKKIEKAWKGMKAFSKKDYSTTMKPGSEIRDPEMIEYLETMQYFSIVHILPTKIEYLQLNRDTHVRALFTREADKWNGSFLVP